MGESGRGESGVRLRLDELALARLEHDRAAELRSDGDALEALWRDPATRVLRVSKGHVESVDGALLWRASADCAADDERYFLGLHGGTAYFASTTTDGEFTSATLRELGAGLGDLEVGLVVHAVALAQWHATHSACARCGGITASINGGSSRRCERCEAEHYPRTDPAVIVLVRDPRDRILLGRQAAWPPGRFSTFAGFVEPGESFEAAVRREVAEESGVTVGAITYLGSQPWPFPASVMIAFDAVTTEPDLAKADGTEIEQVRWLTRDELADAVRDGEIVLPPSVSIARKMIEAWFGRPLHGGEAWR
jgi:NAD+ diphosphatase